jgi:hypothetical protein
MVKRKRRGEVMFLSVITSYYNRFDNLKLWLENIVYNANIEFIIASNDFSKIDFEIMDRYNIKYIERLIKKDFNIGDLHNLAIDYSEGKWLLKKDIDCYIDNKFYIKLINHLKGKDDNYFMNIPCKNYKNGGGSQWVCSKKKYIEVEGEPEFDGYGFEDTVLLYKLYRQNNPKLKFKNNNCHDIILNKVSKIKNQEAMKQGFFMNHNPINIKNNINYFKNISKNYDKMYEICKLI